MTTIIWLDCEKWVIKVFKTLSKLVNIWSFMIGGYNDTHPSCTRVRFKIWPLDWKSGIKFWFWWILSSINDWIGRMWPMKISWCYSKMTHVHNALNSNPIWLLDWKNAVRYWCSWSMTTIRWTDCEKWVVKVCKTLLNLFNIWSSMVNHRSWVYDHSLGLN